MERIGLPKPIFRFQATDAPSRFTINCFPLSGGKVAVTDQTGRAYLCAMPNLHTDMFRPISLFITPAPSANVEGGGSLYVMERIPKPESGIRADKLSDQFEAIVWCGKTSEWHCHRLPPPPFVRDPTLCFTHPNITSYAVVGSNICISTNKINATHCLDTATNTWQAATGTLPLYGKAEYVPELKLWFGFSAQPGQRLHLSAADLSSASDTSQPQLIGDCQEFFDPPEGWLEDDDPQLVNLGSGRLCIARFFQTMSVDYDEIIDRFVVFTGVEVMPVGHHGDGTGNGRKVKLGMKKHKSRCHKAIGTLIRDIF